MQEENIACKDLDSYTHTDKQTPTFWYTIALYCCKCMQQNRQTGLIH